MKLVRLLILQIIKKMQRIKKYLKKTKTNSGVSLLEIMVVVIVFTILGVLTTNAVFLTLRGTQKSQSIQKVREKMNYVVSIIQRQLRGAQRIMECPNNNPLVIEFSNEDSIASSFSCAEIGEEGYIASGSARLTSDDISITSCSFVCEEEAGSPAVISVTLTAEDAEKTGIIKGKATFNSTIILRNY